MGGGASSPFKSVPVETELPRQLGDAEVGRVAHLVGTVTAADGKVISSPFGNHNGPAIRIYARRQLLGNQTSHGAFSAQSALDFYVTDGAANIRVVVSDVEAWAWKLKPTHEAFNIMRSAAGDALLSGGKNGEHSKIEVRPDAIGFWERLNGGRDPIHRIQIIAPERADATLLTTPMHNEDKQLPRMAVEQTLQLGDTVAVIGVLGRAPDGELTISPQTAKGKGTITNDATYAASLAGAPTVQGGVSGALTDDVRIVSLGKHKKAKTYGGKKW